MIPTKTQERCMDMADEHSLFRAASWFLLEGIFLALVYYTAVFVILGMPSWFLR